MEVMGPHCHKRDPYHSGTLRDSYGSGMGGVRLFGSPEFPFIFLVLFPTQKCLGCKPFFWEEELILAAHFSCF